MRGTRMLRAAVIGVIALALAACSGLPTAGPVGVGLRVDDIDPGIEGTFLASGPALGADPAEIVTGFIDAGMSPVGNWAIARQFLSPELAASWRPEAAVTIDRSYLDRSISYEVESSERVATATLTLSPVASVDATGVYSEEAPDARSGAPFELARDEDGEWRITSALDGIVLDQELFGLVFRKQSLQYFDPAWQHLVPDPRWFPRRETLVTNITQALIAGDPSEWLDGSVRSAFPLDVLLAVDAVPVGADDHVAEVALTPSALTLDETTLGRMRIQLERSLSSTGVRSVRFTVDGNELVAERAEVVSNRIDSATYVLTDTGFGAVVGDEIAPLAGVSTAIGNITAPIAAIDVSGDTESAAVQLASGAVLRVSGGLVDSLDPRPGLVAPTMDAQSFTWTVPRGAPGELVAWSPDGVAHPIAAAWPEATAISQVRIAPDGVRIAAVVTVDGREWAALAGIVRDAAGVPTALGPVELINRLPGAAAGLAWLGDDTLGLLSGDGEAQLLLELTIGGPGSRSPVPSDTVAIAGANTVAGARLLSSAGVVSTKRGTSWQETVLDVRVLATQSGK